jgi:hypothetical protein
MVTGWLKVLIFALLAMTFGAPLTGAAMALFSSSYSGKAVYELATRVSAYDEWPDGNNSGKCQASLIVRHDNDSRSFGEDVVLRSLGDYRHQYVTVSIDAIRASRLFKYPRAISGALNACADASLLANICSRVGRSIMIDRSDRRNIISALREAQRITERASCTVIRPDDAG